MLGAPEGGMLPRPAVAAAAATEAAAASSGVWVAQSWLHRRIISFGVAKDLVLIWALMWRGSLRMKRAICASSRVLGRKALRVSQSTNGLVSLLHIG